MRVTKIGEIGNARPCHNCLKMMKDIGIKKVFYSTGEGDKIVCEHVRNMVSIQSSSVTRFLNYQVNIKTGYVFILDDSNMILIKSQLI